MKKLISGFNKICGGMQQLVGFMLFVAAILAAINAVMRKFAGISWTPAEEVCTYLCLLSVFIGLPKLEIGDDELSIDIFNNSIKNEKLKKVVFLIRGIITMICFGLLFWAGISQIQNTYANHAVTSVLHIPRYLLYIVVDACYAIVIFSWIAIFLNKGRPVKDDT